MIRLKEKKVMSFASPKRLIVSLLYLVMLISFNSCGEQASLIKKDDMTEKIIEIVIMKVKTGITDNEFFQAAKSVDKVTSNFTGFISRELAKDENGNWIDIVYWTDLNSAQKATEEVVKSQTCNIFFGMIDEQSMKMYHFEPVHQFSK